MSREFRRLPIFFAWLIANFLPLVVAVEPSRPDCHEKILDFHGCVNKTIREKHTPGQKMQLFKIHVNECLQKNHCARMYLDVIQNDEIEAQNRDALGAHASRQKVHHCIRDFHEHAEPLIEKCVSEVVPDAAFIRKEPHENKWSLLQHALNKTQLQRLCGQNGSSVDAGTCIDRLLCPDDRARKREKQRFKEFCTAARQCKIGMGLCRTELDNARKAMCDCTARIFEQFDAIRVEVPSCANLTSDAIRSARRFHLPFTDDCGPDPCDISFESLTRGGDDSDTDSSTEP